MTKWRGIWVSFSIAAEPAPSKSVAILMRRLLALFAAAFIASCGMSREDLPWEPLMLEDPLGMTTSWKLAGLRDDPARCAETLASSGLEYSSIDAEPAQPECALAGAVDITQSHIPYGEALRVSCPLAAAIYVWEREVVAPAALTHLGVAVTRIDQIGTYSCRRLYNREEGRFSQHATANAIDIAGFRFEGGQRISVLRDWEGDTPEAAFLRAVRDGGCGLFSGVLGPEYNAAHADHLHLDMGPYRICS